MQLRSQPPAHLAYCLNVHPGESLADEFNALRDYAAPIRDLVAPGRRFGVGLRISNRAALELECDANLQALKSQLAARNLYAFTINGFPFGAFHGAGVKENVYRPDWRTAERRDYTCRLGRQLAAILPDGLTGSISTVPGSYKAWIRSPADIETMVSNLADVGVYLAGIGRETGKEINLGLEPEPDCYLETTSETIDFFNRHLLPLGIQRIVATLGCPPAAAEEIIRRHIGVCFDTCHLALQFEDLADSLRRYAEHGIRVSKIQISAAIKTTWQPAAAEVLRRFCDPVYLHQVKTRVDGNPVSRGDLAAALAAPAARPGEEWRIHCHLPLYFTQDGPIASTADQLTPAFFHAAIDRRVEHFEIETYTFDVLPEALRRLGINNSIAEEYRWVLALLK